MIHVTGYCKFVPLEFICEKISSNFLNNIVVTYFQFDSNIRVLYVFLGFLKNT
jgi:hypothetical protein